MERLIQGSIALLRKGEKLALALNPEDGYFLAFSGGKDSQVLMALCDMAGVKYTAYYQVTGNDPPKNVYFIREQYPSVRFLHPQRNYFRLVEVSGLPTIQRRFCCDKLKERIGAGNVVLTGVRAEESKRRAQYEAVEIFSRRAEHQGKPRGRSVEQIMENEHQCIKGQDRVMLRPMLEWTEEDVWRFIREYGLPVNPCYRETGRVGCMFCPFSNRGQIGMYETEYPLYKEALLRSLRKYWQRFPEHKLPSPEEYYKWWRSKKTVKAYLKEKGVTDGEK